MKMKSLVLPFIGIFMLAIVGCSDNGINNNPPNPPNDPTEPEFSASLFSNPTTIDNTYLPMTPGTY